MIESSRASKLLPSIEAPIAAALGGRRRQIQPAVADRDQVLAVAECFGENLRRIRRRKGLSQERVAVRASLHRTEIGFLQQAKRVPRIDT